MDPLGFVLGCAEFRKQIDLPLPVLCRWMDTSGFLVGCEEFRKQADLYFPILFASG